MARPAANGTLDIVDRRNTITRLGQGVGASGRLVDEAVERTLAYLRGYWEVLDRHGVEELVAATSASRDAANRDEFFTAVEDVVGVRPSYSAATRRGACRSSAPPATSTTPSARSSSSTSAAGPPSSSSAPTRSRA